MEEFFFFEFFSKVLLEKCAANSSILKVHVIFRVILYRNVYL